MKNLLADSLFNYIKSNLDEGIDDSASGKEIRIFTASFHPEVLLETFELLEKYIFNNNSNKKVQAIYKVSHGLWKSWQGKYNQNTLDRFTGNHWVDLENKLTFYRNMKISANNDLMLTILCGIEKSADQGGLKDFHIVDEETIWQREMNKDLSGWINRFLDSLHIYHKKSASINNFFKELYKTVLRDLNDLSIFLNNTYEENKHNKIFENSDDVLDYLYRSLPRWGIPPIISSKYPDRLAKSIKPAFEFINYQRYMDRSKVKSDREKLETFINKNKNTFFLPSSVSKKALYSDTDDYFQSLASFINNGDEGEKAKLLQVNILPLLNDILKTTRKKNSVKKETVRTVKGNVFKAFLDSIWEASLQFSQDRGYEDLRETVEDIRIKVDSYKHNLESEDEKDHCELADELLKCCIGGINETFENLHITLRYNDNNVPVERDIKLSFNSDWDNVPTKPTNTGTSRIEFEVGFFAKNDGNDGNSQKLKAYKFKWLLKDSSEELTLFRYSGELLRQLDAQKNHTYLPCFHLPTFNELFLANDSDEAGRLFNMGYSGFRIKDMLKKNGSKAVIPDDKDLKGRIHNLNLEYKKLFHTILKTGYFNTMINNSGYMSDVINRYRELFEYIKSNLNNLKDMQKDILALLYKAYMFIPDDFNVHEKYLPLGVTSLLHPSILEIIQARESFLKASFAQLISVSISSGNIKSGKKKFGNLVKRCGIRSSIPGLITDRNGKITSRTLSYGHIQCIGRPGKDSPSLASQSLLKESDEYEEITDMEMFSQDGESDIYLRLLKDYVELYPYGKDGIEVGIVNIKKIQSVICGIDGFLSEVLKERKEEDPPYHLSLTLLSENTGIQSVKRWINAWKQRWQNDESKYENCRISIKYRSGEIAKLIEKLGSEKRHYDIVFAERFLDDTEVNKLEIVDKFCYSLSSENYLKFPLVEFPFPEKHSNTGVYKRERVVSNRRFQIPTIHSEITARLKEFGSDNSHFIVIAESEYKEDCRKTIDNIHALSNWVVCMDSSIDSRLIKETSGSNTREIIGYSSGVGAQGELNYTVSSDFRSLSDVKIRLKNKLKELFGWTDDEELNYISGNVLKQAVNLAGMSIIRATGIDNPKLRDLIAYSIVRKYLVENDKSLCNEIIVLDSFLHWFENSELTYRPDLLHIKASLKGNRIHVEATILECKLAQANQEHITKAKAQVESGLKLFVNRFMPAIKNKTRDDFYDARYWWAQLERIIAVNGKVSGDSKTVYEALEAMTEGDYSICWKGALVTFWTDAEGHHINREKISIPIGGEYKQVHVTHIQLGNSNTKEICKGNFDSLKYDFTEENLCFPPKISESEALAEEISDFTDDESDNSFTDYQLEDEEKLDEAEEISPSLHTSETEKGTDAETEDIEDKENDYISEGSSVSDEPEIVVTGGEAPVITDYIEGIPSRIFLGTTNKQQPVYWEYGHRQLTNRHLLILGKSGTGKTYAIQTILAEFAKHKQNSVIVDYTQGFTHNQLEDIFLKVAKPHSHFVIQSPLPINPFRKQTIVLDEVNNLSIPEKPHITAMRVISVLDSVYILGEQQIGRLSKIMEEGLELFGSDYSFSYLLEKLDEQDDKLSQGLSNKLGPFVKTTPFGKEDPESWKKIYSDKTSSNFIIQLTGLPRELYRMITEFILWDFYFYARNYGSKNSPTPLVLDEIQNLSHNKDAPLAGILQEGRKFGISAILATQILSQFKPEEKDRLFQTSHKLFFQPAESEIKEYGKLLERLSPGYSSDYWENQLSALQKGECISVGPGVDNNGNIKKMIQKISVTSFEKRNLL